MESSKKILLSTIGIAILVVLVSGVTFAIFNYTRTGSSNTISVGKINFNTSGPSNQVSLTNVIPILSSEVLNDENNVAVLNIDISGDTEYEKGIEYLLTAESVNNSINNKEVPISVMITYEGKTDKVIGVEDENYFTNRGGNTSIYKLLGANKISEDTSLLVGYIKQDTVGIDGTITIRAYIDSNDIIVSDTLNEQTDKCVLTTDEWNSLQGNNGLSFKVKVEANAGIWVEEPVTFAQELRKKASTVNYIASYDDIIEANPTFTTQDQVSTSSTKQTVYYFTGDDAAANANVLFAGYCWQIIRTTDNGGVRMIYNGVAKKGVTLTTEIIADTNITYTNDGTYPYTYDLTTKKWTSTNHTNSATGTLIFTVKEAGDYLINYNVSSEAGYDKAKFYKNNTLIKEDSGTKEGSIELGTLTTTDEIKVEYTKDGSSASGNDNVIFEISKVINRVESENLQCQPNRTATKGINGADGTSTSLSGTSLFGRSYDYDLDTGEFTIQDSTGLPTSWNNTNYKDLIGTYTCNSSSATCTTLYYVGSYVSSTEAYTSSYTIGYVAHFSQLGTSAFNPNYESPALVGYMFNNDYDYKSGSKSGEYYTNAVWENGAYTLSNGNGGTAPDATHHYICDSDCTKVRYYYYVSGSDYYYILLENGKTVEDALKEMINYKTNENDSDENINVYNSAIKGYLENWYKKNLTGYTSYLDSESAYCNDRSIKDLGGWNPSGTSITGDLQFKQYSANIDLNCLNETDRFAVTNNKAKLIYPIGLLTEPERNLMTANFAKTGQYYWGASPYGFVYDRARVRYVTVSGVYNYTTVYLSNGARGVISLKPGTKLENGSGTYDNPYIVGPLVTRNES